MWSVLHAKIVSLCFGYTVRVAKHSLRYSDKRAVSFTRAARLAKRTYRRVLTTPVCAGMPDEIQKAATTIVVGVGQDTVSQKPIEAHELSKGSRLNRHRVVSCMADCG